MGGGSSTSTVRKRDPESAELTNMRSGIYNMLAPLAGMQPSASALPASAAVASGGNSADYPLLEFLRNGTVDASGGTSVTKSASGSPALSDGAWGNSLFGSSWLDTQRRIKNSNDQYDMYAQSAPGLQNNVISGANKISSAADNLKDNSNAVNALSGKISSVGDDIYNVTKSGEIPRALTDNMNKSVNTELNENTGALLNNLASKGVLNSSVTNRGVNSLADSAADAYAKNYLSVYNSVLNWYQSAGSQYQNAISGYNSANATINDEINALNSALNGYTSALTNNTDLMKSAAAMPSTLNESLWSSFQPVYSYWKDLQNSYDNREDYDTVVSSGK